MNRRMFFQAVAVGSVLLVLAALAAVALGSPANGVTPTVLARGTYDSFKVRSYPQGPRRLQGRGQGSDRHRRAPPRLRCGLVDGLAHAIPARCSSRSSQGRAHVLRVRRSDVHAASSSRAGQGYVDTGRGHIARNEYAPTGAAT